MTNKIILAFVLCLMASGIFAYGIGAEKGMEKYTEKVNTELGSVINSIYNSRLEAMDLFRPENKEAITEEMTYLLGCTDLKKNIELNLGLDYSDSLSIVSTLKNVKIMSYEKAKEKPTLVTGYVSYEFTQDGKTNLVFSSMIDQEEEGNEYLPILIDKDGNIAKKDDLVSGLMALGGNTNLKGALLLLGTVNKIISGDDGLKITYPFSRWLNEGMNYKITSLILHKINYKYAKDFDALFALSQESQNTEANLWNFTQRHLVINSEYSGKEETANIQYSCRLADRIYEKCGRDGFHKIFTEMKYSDMLTTPQICKIIKDQTGVDAYGLLNEYIPEKVRSLMDSKKLDSMEAEAYKLIEDKKYKEAIPVLENVLLGDPYRYNGRLNLARCYREEGDVIQSDKNVFLASNSMFGEVTINIYGEENISAKIIMGKFLFMLEDIASAYECLKEVYETDKSEDIKKMLDSIELTRENMRKELYGGE